MNDVIQRESRMSDLIFDGGLETGQRTDSGAMGSPFSPGTGNSLSVICYDIEHELLSGIKRRKPEGIATIHYITDRWIESEFWWMG